MRAKFSFLSWNVEHFKGGADRLKRVAAHIKPQNPDIFGLLEVENADVLALMRDHFPDYDFAVTDGPEVQEILLGWRRGKFEQAVFTQKREFKAYNPALRPGALLSVRLQGAYYNLLYLHTDSGPDAPAFGNRAEMFAKIGKMKAAIDGIAGGPGKGNLIVLGDLNTMGLLYPGTVKKDRRVSGEEEVAALGAFAEMMNMKPLAKEFDATWHGSGNKTSALDHVLASQPLNFTELGKRDGKPFQVRVRGWNQLTGPARDKFLAEISDHSSLFAQVA